MLSKIIRNEYTLILLLTLSLLSLCSNAAEPPNNELPKPQQVFSGLQASPEIITLSQQRTKIQAECRILSDKRAEAIASLEKRIKENIHEFEQTNDMELLKNKMVKVLMPFVKQLKDISDSSNQLANSIRSHKNNLKDMELFSQESVDKVYREYEQAKRNLHLGNSTVESILAERFGGDYAKLEEAASEDPMLLDYIEELMLLSSDAKANLAEINQRIAKIENSSDSIGKLGEFLDYIWIDIRRFKRDTYQVASKYRSWASKINNSEIDVVISELTSGYDGLKSTTDDMSIIQFEPDNSFEELINKELSIPAAQSFNVKHNNSAEGLADRLKKFLGDDKEQEK